MNQLLAAEGKNVSKDCPLCEHPNPQFRRDSYHSLNGWWDFSIDGSLDIAKIPFDRKILVPFSVETKLSGINEMDLKGRYLYYRKVFDLPEGIDINNASICFEAVDCICKVYLNGTSIGFHVGGYSPFRFDRVRLLPKRNVLCVVVADNTDGKYPIGKQSEKPGGIWYHPTSGIWGSVYLENTPKDHIVSLRYEIDRLAKKCKVFTELKGVKKGYQIDVNLENELIYHGSLNEQGEVVIDLGDDPKEWTPEHPYLYDVTIYSDTDAVHSYFGFRDISKIEINGFLYPALNGKPIFLTGLLDQGYYPESGLTPPTDEAMVKDILKMKAYGFNVVRKHIKIDLDRWYYHCDKLGMLVIQDFVNVGAPYSPFMIMSGPFVRRHWDDRRLLVQRRLHGYPELAQSTFLCAAERAIEKLGNHPSIIAWTIFNEGWGQFDSERVLQRFQEIDNSRLFDANSGWIDQGVGDFCSRHVYFKKVKIKNDHKRILSLSEFGGYSLKVEGHTMSNKSFGYSKKKSKEDLQASIERLYYDEIIPLKKEGLAVAIYTQLTDVEGEINGLLTYDRAVAKVDEAVFVKINQRLKEI